MATLQAKMVIGSLIGLLILTSKGRAVLRADNEITILVLPLVCDERNATSKQSDMTRIALVHQNMFKRLQRLVRI